MNKAEERLLKAIFEVEEMPEDYPDTNGEKIGYAAYALTKTLEKISPALRRLNRCESLLKIGAPDIIVNNEAKMALRHLIEVKRDVDDAVNEVTAVFESTEVEIDDYD
ncbi:MAG TPA: hypothetical protein VFD25_05410 [Clostridia bacterium]|nr:hypothetical protein [Clostridia bacterium]